MKTMYDRLIYFMGILYLQRTRISGWVDLFAQLISLKPTPFNNPKRAARYLTRNPRDFRRSSVSARSRSFGRWVPIAPIRRLNELFHYSASPTPLEMAAIGLTNFAVPSKSSAVARLHLGWDHFAGLANDPLDITNVSTSFAAPDDTFLK